MSWVDRLLMEAPRLLNELDRKARTPLYEAANAGQSDVVEKLLAQSGIAVSASKHNEWSALHAAAIKGDARSVRLLVQRGGAPVDAVNKEGATALHLAARRGRIDVVRALLEELGADPNVLNGNLRSPMLSAAHSGDVDTIEVVAQRASPASLVAADSSGESVCHEFARSVRSESVLVRLAKSVLHDRPEELVRRPDTTGRAPLHVAAVENNVAAVRWLVDAGAEIDARDRSGATTPLHLAAIAGATAAVNLLIDLGADAFAKDASGRDAHGLALAWRRDQTARVLERRCAPVIMLTDSCAPMPRLFFGTYKLGEETKSACLAALELGYRAFDCATFYGNEAQVGEALRESRVPRNKLFVCTKIWNDQTSSGRTREATLESAARFGLEYLDLVLVHWPVRGHLAAFEALRGLQREAVVRSVGVSNYTPADLDDLLPSVPSVNQIEFHPFLYRASLLAEMARRGIAVQAYRTLAAHRGLSGVTHPVVIDIACRYGRTPAQILNRWCLEHGVAVLPKSAHRERMDENACIFDFALEADDVAKLDALTNSGAERAWLDSVYAASVAKDVLVVSAATDRPQG